MTGRLFVTIVKYALLFAGLYICSGITLHIFIQFGLTYEKFQDTIFNSALFSFWALVSIKYFVKRKQKQQLDEYHMEQKENTYHWSDGKKRRRFYANRRKAYFIICYGIIVYSIRRIGDLEGCIRWECGWWSPVDHWRPGDHLGHDPCPFKEKVGWLAGREGDKAWI